MFQRLGLACLIALALAGCGDPSKEDILKRSEGVQTRGRLEQVLGRPADIKKLGPIETWTYPASNGSVTFVITGDSVALSATGDK